MDHPLDTNLNSEVQLILHNHIAKLSQYVRLNETLQVQQSHEIILSLEKLAHICACPPETSSFEEAVRCFAIVEEFLSLTCPNRENGFYETQIGQIYAQADQWFSLMSQKFCTSISQVWHFIEPVVPDVISEIQCSVYEARWWKPVPQMDIEILRRTEGVVIYGESYEPPDLPKGLAVRFSVIDLGVSDKDHE